MKELFEGNLIYLQTYKMAKGLEAQLRRSFKNQYFAMSEMQRANEKLRVEAFLAENPNNVVDILKKKLMKEVENG